MDDKKLESKLYLDNNLLFSLQHVSALNISHYHASIKIRE